MSVNLHFSGRRDEFLRDFSQGQRYLYIDFRPVLISFKNLDSETHVQTTGVDNRQILENLRYLAPRMRTWIRVPLISGYNDSDEQLMALIRMAKELGVEKISLLPYHEGGLAKAAQVGMEYGFKQAEAPDDERVQYLKEMIESNGLIAGLGG